MAKLRRINLDTTWLLTLPASSEYATRTANLLLDPWLHPSEQVDVAPYFSTQRRRTPAIAASISELETILQHEEEDGQNEEASLHQDGNGSGRVDRRPVSTRIDAIILSHPFTDHMHPETLKDPSLSNETPILAVADAINPLRSVLGRQRKVCTIASAGTDAPSFSDPEHRLATLPPNIQILQAMPTEKSSLLRGPSSLAWQKLHGGIIVAWTTGAEQEDALSFSSIVYSPHGLSAASIPRWLRPTGPTRESTLTQDSPSHASQPLALITSFDRFELPAWISGTVNLGLQRALDVLAPTCFPASFLVDTHGEHKEASGIIAKLLRRFWLGLPEPMTIGAQGEANKEDRRQTEAQRCIDGATDKLQTSGTQAIVLDVGSSLQL